MSVIIIPRKHLRQPQGRVAPISGCDAAIATTLAEYSHAGLERWMINGSMQTQINAAPGFPVGTGALSAPEALTVLSIWRPRKGADYLNADSATPLIESRAVSSGYSIGRSGAAGGSGAGNVTRQTFTLFGVGTYTQSTFTIPGQRDTTVATVWDGEDVSFWDDGGSPRGFVMREKIPVGTVVQSNTHPLLLGSSSVNFRAAVSVLLVWPRALSVDELTTYARNPWKLFRADPIRTYSFPPGPVGVSWSSLTASNITQTGATLTLGGITR